MTPEQEEALGLFTNDFDSMKAVFNKPLKISLDKKRDMLVTLHTAVGLNIHQGFTSSDRVWHCAVRIAKDENCKLQNIWMNFERYGARGQLILCLDGVGEPGTMREWTGDYTIHMAKKMTEEEIKLQEEILEKKFIQM